MNIIKGFLIGMSHMDGGLKNYTYYLKKNAVSDGDTEYLVPI